MTGFNYFLDSSVWLGYFKEGQKDAAEIIESENNLSTSVINLYEIVRKLAKNGTRNAEIEKRLDFIKNISAVVGVSSDIAQKAAGDSIKHGLHAIDALIYRSARESNATLVTMDYDFHKLPEVRIVKQS